MARACTPFVRSCARSRSFVRSHGMCLDFEHAFVRPSVRPRGKCRDFVRPSVRPSVRPRGTRLDFVRAFVRPLVRPRGTCRDFVRAFVRPFSLVRTSSRLKNPVDPSPCSRPVRCVCVCAEPRSGQAAPTPCSSSVYIACCCLASLSSLRLRLVAHPMHRKRSHSLHKSARS